ncbi:hypothetical protein ACHAWU_005049 [Discostella pseudostelligera]|uniref:Methyltransferase type 11 domain-containing protein n=1 Tax=Discostella pseudostelligera TaxID=259834 RepID=A0ABD3M2Y1_9STRA
MVRVTGLLLTTTFIFLSNLTIPTTAFGRSPSTQRTSFERLIDNADEIKYEDDDARKDFDLPASLSSSPRRRSLLRSAASVTMGTVTASSLLPSTTTTSYAYGCGCGCSRSYYDKARNSCLDRFFSYCMSTGMDDYEAKAFPYKSRLFDKMLRFLSQAATSSSAVEPSSSSSSKTNNVVLDNQRPVILEVGMGTFPNAPYYAHALRGSTTATSTTNTAAPDGILFKQGLDIISLDPNDYMFEYAIDSATKSGLLSPSSPSSSLTSLRNVHGVAEALPFGDGTIDAVVGTLTLCSVTDQLVALKEIQRVLKPRTGVYLFWEHVLSEKDVGLAFQQRLLSPLQTIVADGCHLDRRTGWNIEQAGFRGGVEIEYMMLDLGVGASIISPTVFGIAYT